MTRCVREKLPHWHAAATKLFLHMPSSASVERVFSVLKNIIGDQQSNGLKDLVEGTMLVNFTVELFFLGSFNWAGTLKFF